MGEREREIFFYCLRFCVYHRLTAEKDKREIECVCVDCTCGGPFYFILFLYLNIIK